MTILFNAEAERDLRNPRPDQAPLPREVVDWPKVAWLTGAAAVNFAIWYAILC